MSEANVEIIRRHCEIRHSQGGKRHEVGMDDWSYEHPRPWIALVRRCGSARCSASSRDRRADDLGRAPPHVRSCAGSPPRRASGGALRRTRSGASRPSRRTSPPPDGRRRRLLAATRSGAERRPTTHRASPTFPRHPQADASVSPRPPETPAPDEHRRPREAARAACQTPRSEKGGRLLQARLVQQRECRCRIPGEFLNASVPPDRIT